MISDELPAGDGTLRQQQQARRARAAYQPQCLRQWNAISFVVVWFSMVLSFFLNYNTFSSALYVFSLLYLLPCFFPFNCEELVGR